MRELVPGLWAVNKCKMHLFMPEDSTIFHAGTFANKTTDVALLINMAGKTNKYVHFGRQSSNTKNT